MSNNHNDHGEPEGPSNYELASAVTAHRVDHLELVDRVARHDRDIAALRRTIDILRLDLDKSKADHTA